MIYRYREILAGTGTVVTDRAMTIEEARNYCGDLFDLYFQPMLYNVFRTDNEVKEENVVVERNGALIRVTQIFSVEPARKVTQSHLDALAHARECVEFEDDQLGDLISILKAVAA